MKGFDNLAINHHLYMALPFQEAVGVLGDLTYDRSIHHYQFALHGPPTWFTLPSGLGCLDFDPANPDWLDCAGATTTDLDFTTEDFSIVAWVNPGDLTANRMVFCRGFLDVDGYYFVVLIDGSIYFITNQGVHQETISSPGDVVINTWQLIGVSRVDAVANLYLNGVDVTATVGVHVDPVTSAREAHVGIYDNEAGSPWSQYMWNLRIWGDRALTLADHRYIWETERHWLGV